MDENRNDGARSDLPPESPSPAFRRTLAFILAWTEEVLNSGKPFDLQTARKTFGVAPRPRAGVADRTFLAHGVPCRWACAPGASGEDRLLYLHGGGYVCGDLLMAARFARLLSGATGCSVLVADYRLAPEHPFPCALEDAVGAYLWLLENGPEGPAPARKLAVAGESAGGGLTLSTLLKLREQGAPLPDCAVALSPITDLTLSGASLETRAGQDPVLRVELLEFCSKAYASHVDRRDPLVSPLFGDPAGLPPLFLQVGGREILLDDALRFADKARTAGVRVTLDVWPEMFHSWQLFAEAVPEARRALDRVGDFVREVRGVEAS